MLPLYTSVTYETQCHAIGQQEFYRDCCGLKKEFYTLHSSLLLYHNLPAASTSSLKSAGLHAAVEDTAPARVFLWITQQSTNIMFSSKLHLRISNMLIITCFSFLGFHSRTFTTHRGGDYFFKSSLALSLASQTLRQ